MSKFKDITGQKFGRLTTIKRVENKICGKNIYVQYLCKCDCGNEKIVFRVSLINGSTQSCGCLRKENSSNFAKQKFKKYNKYDLSREYGIGWTSNTNEEFYFDLEDYDKIKNYCWFSGKKDYICTRIKNKTLYLHNLILNFVPSKDTQVDHIFHNVKDNRKQKLRIVTHQENCWNQQIRINNTSGKTGVYYRKDSNKWFAQITYNKKRINLGSYKNLEDAINARTKAEEKYFGKYRYKGDQCG